MTIGLLIFNIDYALVLGVVFGILSITPVVGSALALIITLIATYKSGIITLIIIAALFAVCNFIENNVVRPYI